MVRYHHLLIIEREEISRYLAGGLSIREIAQHVRRSPSTISREINRCVVNKKYYRAVFAQQHYSGQLRQIHKSRKLDKNSKLRSEVLRYLALKWSPEQIAKRLKILYPDDVNMQISHESIYSYLYIWPRNTLKKEIISCLRRQHPNRRKRKTRQRSFPIQQYLSIEERPEEVADRIVPGH